MHTPYVPGSSALACEGELEGVLECEDRNKKFQLQEELLDLDPRCVQHPNLSNVTQVFSFEYKPLIAYDSISEYQEILHF
jgi:hypothetical protein